MSLTAQQTAALAARDRSVSLAAGAGCGKTFVLTERFLSHLDPVSDEAPADFSELVAITFTEAAAREMRERIRTRCRERLKGAGSREEADAWRRLLRGLDAAQISTIHSFCGGILRRHAVEAGLDPQFEVLDAPAAELLRLEVVDDGLRELLEARDEGALDLAARRGLARLRADLTRLLGQTHHSELEAWIGASPDELVDRWQAYHEEFAAPAAVDELREHESLAALRPLADPLLAKSDRLQTQLGELAVVLRKIDRGPDNAAEAQALVDELDALARLRGGAKKIAVSAKDWYDPAFHDAFKSAAEAVRKAVSGTILGTAPSEEATLDSARVALELVRLTAALAARLRTAKRQRNQLEFDDLLAGAHRLLTSEDHPAVRQDLAQRTRLLMVDEFQDTDPLQVEIVQALCLNWREAGLFVVGDDKQSIYRFRGAEPTVSREVRSGLPPAGQLSLTTNFRSQPAVLDFVNATFCEEFAGYEPLAPHRPQATPLPAIEFLWAPFADEGDGLAAAAAARGRHATGVELARRREARWIARRIAALIDGRQPLVPETTDAGQVALRPLQLGDVAILLRTLSDLPIYEEALREQGLDYYLAGGHAFYAQQEVFDVLNLLRSTTSLVDEIALMGALRSPLFSLADESLFWMQRRSGTLNAALAAALTGETPAQLDAAERDKLLRAAATIDRLRTLKDRLLVAQLLDEALRLTGYDAVLLGEFLGHRKLANLEKLREQARALDRTSPGDVAGFVTQLAEFVARAPKEPPAATQAEGDVIRIMTIHYAKGLEFPLVVVPDLDRQERVGDSHPVVHRGLGPVVPGESRKQHGLGWLLYRAVENRADREERLRLFYVAATRAADMLVLSANVKDFAKPRSEAMRLLGRRFDLESGEFLGETLPAGVRPPFVNATQEEPASGRSDERAERSADLVALAAECLDRASAGGGAVALPRLVQPLVADRTARRRFSFSQLTGELELIEQDAGSPEPGSENPEPASDRAADAPAGRQLGTLVHAVLERLDFSHPEEIREWCEFLAPLHFAADMDEAAAVASRQIERLFASPRGRDLAAAAEVQREVEFLLPWPPGDKASPNTPRRFLHGYIDCLYRDPAGAWRLVDYKTNRVDPAGVSSAAASYELQLFVYRLACEQALGAPLAESTLLFLDAGVEHAWSWTPGEATAAIARITAAMDRFVGLP